MRRIPLRLYSILAVVFFLNDSPAQNQPMPPRETPGAITMTCETITTKSRIAAENGSIRENYRQTLPIPVLKNREVLLVFFYYNSINRPRQPSLVDHPAWMQTVRYPSGEILEMRRCTPEEFGFAGDGKPLGELAQPEGMSFDDYNNARVALLRAFDQLMPAFQASTSRSADDGGAREKVLELFGKLSEPPLKPYYQTIGAGFFQWVKG